MTYDTSALIRTSEKANLPWRDPKLTFIWLRTNGQILTAHTMADKRSMLGSLQSEDQVLAVRQVQYPQHQQVMAVDDVDAARRALAD